MPSDQQTAAEIRDAKGVVVGDSDDEIYYANSRGSGLAAVVAFFDITVCGVLLFEAYFLAMRSNRGLLASPHLIWQFFLPLGLAAILYMPSDPLTRVLGICARASAAVGVLGLFLGIARAFRTDSVQISAAGISNSSIAWNLAIGAVAALAVGLVARALAKGFLQHRDQ